MSKRSAIDFSTPVEELLGGGGGLINPGFYKVEQSHFMMSKLGESATREALVLYQKLQPVDKDGEDSGDVIERRWTTNETIQDGTIVLELVDPIKGRKGCYSGIAFTDANTHQKLYKKSEFGVFIEHCHKAELDMDSIGNAITAMEDNIYEYGLFTWPEIAKTPVEVAENGKEGGASKKKYSGPKQTIIIVGEFDGKKSTKKSTKKDEDEDDAPKSKSKSKKKSDEPDDAEGWVAKYLEDEVCTNDNEEDGAGHTDHKLSIPKWLDKQGVDAKMKKEVMGIYNNVEDEDDNALFAILEKLGWEYKAKKKLIVKKED